MHSLLVCVSALCFCQLFGGAIGSGTGALCKECRVNVIYPESGIPPPEMPKNHKIVRIVNEYKRISREEMEYRDEIRMLKLRSKEFSFIAKVKVGNSTRCSAALVAPSVAITSSTCFLKEIPHQIEIIFHGGRTFEVDNLVKPEWCPELSLLHLKTPSDNSPNNLCHGDLPLGINASKFENEPVPYYTNYILFILHDILRTLMYTCEKKIQILL